MKQEVHPTERGRGERKGGRGEREGGRGEREGRGVIVMVLIRYICTNTLLYCKTMDVL